MREAIGSGLLFNLIISFVIIMIAFLIGSLAYSKAFKAKNRIINLIDSNEGIDSDLITKIDESMEKMGYKVNSNKSCENIDVNSEIYEPYAENSTYDYCLYQISTEDGNYYRVVTYMSFEIPVINTLLRFPVSGESKVIRDSYLD